MKASQTYQCIVAERLFGEDNAYITRMPAQAGDHEKRIESRWELSCKNPKEVASDA
ncbi:TPA: hypothetical protein NL046_003875 [Pseudomonas aeruginosa]|uniref:hypothetical protein n=1 Tax=Pseudomonas aeruginosa TaxID=287 RepID=UPI00044FC6A2|nr:hypothetical protein [Pseudomonas aeruginosa]EIU2788245.1 hypothetical protein [Pseudomonas aeruginosa]EKV3005887.1 hypothetical protein [Pseudomonas aeruginosa]EKV3128643.1 hypothetical protein [Pseudomonas aeruginosa]EKX6175663.1 hypothetical protein [Pseudomonas aeruginosa]ELM3814796.1 hypothetical protein [Pseudomonas aeruginosa]